MSDVVPGRQRGFLTRDVQRDAVPVTHCSLGRLWDRRHHHDPGPLHIVIENTPGIWTVLCSGARALRSFRGRPDQAQCATCRAHRTSTAAPEDLPPLPPSGLSTDAGRIRPETAEGRSGTATLSGMRDAKLRRCRCCGEWAWDLDPCTVCTTPAEQQAVS